MCKYPVWVCKILLVRFDLNQIEQKNMSQMARQGVLTPRINRCNAHSANSVRLCAYNEREFGFRLFPLLYLYRTNAPGWSTAFTVHYVDKGSNSKRSYIQAFRCSTLYWPIQISVRALFHRLSKTVCHHSCWHLNAATSPEYGGIRPTYVLRLW